MAVGPEGVEVGMGIERLADFRGVDGKRLVAAAALRNPRRDVRSRRLMSDSLREGSLRIPARAAKMPTPASTRADCRS